MSSEITGNYAAAQTQQTSAIENEQTKPADKTATEMPESISNLNQLREASPEIYDEILKGIFNTIKSQEDKSKERVKKMNREAYQ